MRYDWARYQRQLGLVYQQRVMRLRVFLAGEDPALTYALINLALLGAGASEDGELIVVSRRAHAPVTEDDVVGQVLLRREDIGESLDFALPFRLGQLNPDCRCQVVSPDEAAYTKALRRPPDVTLALGALATWVAPTQRIIYGRTGYLGVALGAQPSPYLRVAQQGEGLLTTGLASLLGALLAQETLRVCRLLRPYPIERFWLSANLRLAPGVRAPTSPYLDLAGVRLPAQPDASAQAGGDPLGDLYRAVLPFDSDLTRLLWGAITINEETPPDTIAPVERLHYSPFTRWRAPQTAEEAQTSPDGLGAPTAPALLSGKRLVIGGAGGLGSWALMALAASPLHDSEALIFESDAAVEQHNLNRQILYRPEDVGLPKAVAIAKSVAPYNPTLCIQTDTEHLTWDKRVRLQPLLARADIALTTFDNFAARYLLGLAACQAKAPLINGGSSVFAGDVELARADYEGCIECFWEAEDGPTVTAHRREATEGQSCSREDDDVGQIGTAIVTTNAIIGSIQALLTLAYLATPHQPPQELDHKVQYVGQHNWLSRCRLPIQLNRTNCMVHHAQSSHYEHLARYVASSVDTSNALDMSDTPDAPGHDGATGAAIS